MIFMSHNGKLWLDMINKNINILNFILSIYFKRIMDILTDRYCI